MKSINLNRIHAVLKLLFKNLSEENIRSIENKITIKKFTKNEIILKSKNNIEDLYILLDGIIQVGYLGIAGRLHIFHYYSEKSYLNLATCLQKNNVDYDYYAFTPVQVLILPQQIFQQLLQENKNLYIDLLDLVTARMCHLIHEVKFLHVANLHQKLCKVLLELSDRYGCEQQSGIQIQLKMSQHDLADLLSTSRQTINKELKKLVSLNIISCQYENIIIHDLNYLIKQVKSV